MPWRDLNKGSFNCAPLTEEARDMLINEAKIACKYLIVNATTAADTTPVDKVAVNEKTGRHATFRKIKDTVDPKLEGVHAYTRVRATIEDVADFFHLNTPIKLENYDRVMRDWVVKLTTLYTLIERSDRGSTTKPLYSCGVIWKVTKVTGTQPRDLCLLDYHDEFTYVDQNTGEARRGWARCIHSIKLSCCPDLNPRYGLLRTTVVRSGHVFIESSEPGELDYYKVHITVPPRGSVNQFTQLIYRTMLKFYSSTVLHFEEHFIRERIKPMLDLPVSRFQHKLKTDYCAQCFTRFTWMTTCRQCRGCGDAVCQKCSSKWSILLDTHKHAIKVDMCRQCVTGETKRRRPAQPKSGAASIISITLHSLVVLNVVAVVVGTTPRSAYMHVDFYAQSEGSARSSSAPVEPTTDTIYESNSEKGERNTSPQDKSESRPQCGKAAVAGLEKFDLVVPWLEPTISPSDILQERLTFDSSAPVQAS
ncbi:unnamed protein product [Aphanomyces euteiches]